MPPRVRGVNDRTPGDFYWSLPPITRLLTTLYLITCFAFFFKVLPIKHLYLDWSLVFQLRSFPQIWRTLGCFTFIGPPSLKFLFQLIWLLQYGGAYEKSTFSHNAADGVTMLLFGMASTLVVDLCLPFLFHSYFHASTLIFMFVYLWSKQNQNSQVSFFGLLQVQGLYLPFILLLIDFLQKGDYMTDILGILVGHLYWFLTDVYPAQSGRRIIQTPVWLARLVYRARLGNVPVQQLQPINPSDPTFTAFRGRGRRLGD